MGPHPRILGDPAKGKQNKKWLPHRYLVGGPKEGVNATSTLYSRGFSTNRTKIRRGCPSLAFSGAQKRAEMWRNPCVLGDPQQTGPKPKVATSALAQKRAEMPRHSCILGDPQQRGVKSEVAASPLPSQGPKRGRKCYVTPAFWGSSTNGCKISTGCLKPAFSGAQRRAKMRCHPCILGDPQQRGAKSVVVASPPPSRGAQKRAEMLRHPCIVGHHQQRGPK